MTKKKSVNCRKWNIEKPKTGFAIYKFQINPGPVFD